MLSRKVFFGGMQIEGHLPPMPLVKQAEEVSTDLGIQEDTFKKMGLKAVRTSDQRLWEQKISYERKAAHKRWMEHDIQPFPLSEDVLYSYIKACGDSAPTYPKSLMRAIGFARHVLGLDLRGDVLESGRIRGCVDSHYSNRRKLQRPPPSVQQVSDLEMIVKDDSRSDSDKLAAGYTSYA